MIQFLPLGGAGEIGANCYYLNIDGTGILLDCGMHPQKIGLDSMPNFNLLENKPVDYILISHAHQDHLNALPFLIKKFPHIKIVTTPQTRAIAELTLHNAISIIERQVKDEKFEIYSHDEVDLLIKSIDYKSYNEKFTIRGLRAAEDNLLDVQFFDAGHILGSAGILIENKNSKIFFTGDINLSAQTLLKGAQFPSSNINTLITETTYGATDSSNLLSWDDETERFAISLNSVINNSGSVLIPVFSLGKLQEVLAMIWLLMLKNKIAKVDIYTGGIGRKLCRIYDYNRYVIERTGKDLALHDIPQKNINEVKNHNDFFKYPSIILAASGMMIENTASYLLSKIFLKKKDSAIFTVGYMDENSPGYKISGARKDDKIQLSNSEKKIRVKCSIENFRFSAHAKREEIIELVKTLNPQNVLLVHGDPDAIDWTASTIKKQFPDKKLYIPENSKEILFD